MALWGHASRTLKCVLNKTESLELSLVNRARLLHMVYSRLLIVLRFFIPNT